MTALKARITWRCFGCGEPVAARTGYIHLDFAEMRRHKEQTEAWKAARIIPGRNHLSADGTAMKGNPREGGSWGEVDLGAEMARPDRGRWQVHHRACDPLPDDGGYYWFGTERAATWADLLHWTLHLVSTKGWLEDTDWTEFAEKILSENRQPDP